MSRHLFKCITIIASHLAAGAALLGLFALAIYLIGYGVYWIAWYLTRIGS